LLFAYTPLITGSWIDKCQIGFFSLFGIYALNALLQRYAEGPMPWWKLVIIVAGGAAAFVPLQLWLNIIGAVVVLLVIYSTMGKQHPVEHSVVSS